MGTNCRQHLLSSSTLDLGGEKCLFGVDVALGTNSSSYLRGHGSRTGETGEPGGEVMSVSSRLFSPSAFFPSASFLSSVFCFSTSFLSSVFCFSASFLSSVFFSSSGASPAPIVSLKSWAFISFSSHDFNFNLFV